MLPDGSSVHRAGAMQDGRSTRPMLERNRCNRPARPCFFQTDNGIMTAAAPITPAATQRRLPEGVEFFRFLLALRLLRLAYFAGVVLRPATTPAPSVFTDKNNRPAIARRDSPWTKTSFTACSRNSFV